MKTINLARQENVKFTLFPDNQTHATIDVKEILDGDEVQLIAPLRSSNEVMELLQVSNALDHRFCKKKSLVIPYLLGARSDREMNPGDSIDLEVIAGLINGCHFERVNLFDVHSEVASLLIWRSKNHNNSKLVQAYDKENAVLIVPDAGASKKTSKYLEWNPKITSVVNCVKSRDLVNQGRIKLTVLEPNTCAGKDCVIIDDLCDGGATFNIIAESLRNQGVTPKSLTLIVSHGIFSKGFMELEKNFQQIITSDSYRSYYESKIVTVLPLFAKL